MTETQLREQRNAQKNLMYVLMIDDLIRSIKDQNLEIVALRRQLINCMKPECQKEKKTNLCAALYPQTIPLSYLSFVEDDCNGEDPFEEAEYLRRMKRYAAGKTTANHPGIRLEESKKI